MGEGVLAHDGLVELYVEARHRRHAARDMHDLGGVDARAPRHDVIARLSAPSPPLPARCCPRVRPRPLIVHSTWRAPPATAAREFAVAMPRSLWQWVAKITSSAPGTVSIRRLIRSALSHRRGITHRVWDIDRGGTCLDRNLDHAAEVIPFGPRRIHRRPLHVVAQVAGVGDGFMDLLGHLIHCQVRDRAVQRRGADERVNARAVSRVSPLPSSGRYPRNSRVPTRRCGILTEFIAISV